MQTGQSYHCQACRGGFGTSFPKDALTAGRYIVEDQISMPKKNPDAWGAKTDGHDFVGPNLLGRLLMELRDSATLHYRLPSV